MRADFGAAMADAGNAHEAANLLCQACVDLLGVDGAAISLISRGVSQGTFGFSNDRSRRVDDLQFTFGEGPCFDSVRSRSPILVGDLGRAADQRWPAFAEAALDQGVRAVFALPVTIASSPLGALDLIRDQQGDLSQQTLTGGLLAARLAALPLLALVSERHEWESSSDMGDEWDQLASLERVEVYQATGMIIGALDIDSTDALVRLRAYAYARGMTASEAALAILDGRISLDSPDWRDDPDTTSRGAG
jgi:hypothetical protein